MSVQEYYATNGHIVMASTDQLGMGPLERNDWNEDDMCEYRWAVVGDARREELIEQNRALGYKNEIDRRFRHFYRVVAMD